MPLRPNIDRPSPCRGLISVAMVSTPSTLEPAESTQDLEKGSSPETGPPDRLTRSSALILALIPMLSQPPVVNTEADCVETLDVPFFKINNNNVRRSVIMTGFGGC